jgi:hypothetical protein
MHAKATYNVCFVVVLKLSFRATKHTYQMIPQQHDNVYGRGKMARLRKKQHSRRFHLGNEE